MKLNRTPCLPILAAAFFACAGPVEPLPPPPDFSGVVNELRAATATSDAALVLTRADGNAVVHLPVGTRLYQQQTGGALSRIALEALTPGAHVDVWTTGIELRSLPPQYSARQVVVR